MVLIQEIVIMAVKKLKISSEQVPDVEIIGITTTLHDYRLAFFLNKEAGLQLHKLDDLPVFNEKTKESREQSLFTWTDSDQRIVYYLIGNDHPDGKMIDQYGQANYFLFIKGTSKPQSIKLLASLIRKIPSVTFVFEAIPSKIKELDGIMEDLEIHELSQAGKQDK